MLGEKPNNSAEMMRFLCQCLANAFVLLTTKPLTSTSDDFLVTRDAGRSWSVRPCLPKPSGQKEMWAITEALAEADGSGTAKVWNFDSEFQQELALELRTEDYDKTWNGQFGHR